MAKVLVKNIKTGKEFDIEEAAFNNLKTISQYRDDFELVSAPKKEAPKEEAPREEKPKRKRTKKSENE